MELTFVNQYASDSPKRKRLAQACSFCRQRKKRCIHVEGTANGHDEHLSTTAVENHNEEAGTTSKRKRTSLRQSTERSDERDLSVVGDYEDLAGDGRARFVSDLIPESTLLERPVPSNDVNHKQPNDDIGVWVDRREWENLTSQRNVDTVANDEPQRPHAAIIKPLIEIYFQRVHPLLPLLPEEDFRKDFAQGRAAEPLIHAICLVASKDTSALHLLRLSDSDTPVPLRHFSNALHTCITKAIRAPHRIDRITLIRVLALTSLHTQGTEGAEEASSLLSQAMHYSQTLGLHLANQGSAPAGKEMDMKRLFWCLWALDRTNAVTNGRPVIMSDQDMAIEDFTPGESGFPAFEAWLRIAQLLNKVIDFYRPTNDTSTTGWEGDYPGLEEIIDEVGGWQLSASVLATIHLFYLSVGILSHRTRGFREIPRGIASSVRQRLCAIEVVRLMTGPTAWTLHPMPILPYAVSLALSVSYQHLRQSQLEHQQADARDDFRTCCKLLQTLRRTWCSADIMATLAKKVLDELDRAPSLASYRIPRAYSQGRAAGDRPAADAGRDLILPPTACNHDLGREQTFDTASADPASIAGPAVQPEQQQGQDGLSLFDNMDDVFGTFMDPNYPFSLDDMSFGDGLPALDWNVDTSVDK